MSPRVPQPHDIEKVGSWSYPVALLFLTSNLCFCAKISGPGSPPKDLYLFRRRSVSVYAEKLGSPFATESSQRTAVPLA